MDAETTRVVRALVENHLESVVSIRAFKVLDEPGQGGGGQDGDEHDAGEEEEEDAGEEEEEEKTEPPMVECYGTGSIIHCSDRFAMVLSCSHIFGSFRVAGADGNRLGESQIDEDTEVVVDFFDGHTAPGHFAAVDWERDLSLIMVFRDGESRRQYPEVRFAEHTAFGFFAHERETPLYSICTFPAEKRTALFGTGLAGKICAPPRLGRDIDPAFHPELQMFQFLMDGADGCSGAPIFTPTREVMGIWISQVGDFKFGTLVHSICEWIQNTFNFQEPSMKLVVARLVSLYTEKLRLVDP